MFEGAWWQAALDTRETLIQVNGRVNTGTGTLVQFQCSEFVHRLLLRTRVQKYVDVRATPS